MAHLQVYHILFFVIVGVVIGWTLAMITTVGSMCRDTKIPVQVFVDGFQIAGSHIMIQSRNTTDNISKANIFSTSKSSQAFNTTTKSTSSFRPFYFDGQNWTKTYTCEFNRSTLIKANLHTRNGGTPIYIHSPKSDKWISKFIQRSGTWEWTLVNLVLNFLERNDNSHFIDLGANIGVFALSVAKINRKVIAVEPLRANIDRLCASIVDGKLQDKVTVIQNPLSDVYENVSLATAKGNIGGTFVVRDINDVKKENLTLNDGSDVMSAKLDDLLKLPHFKNNFRSVVVKMDVEGSEGRILKGGEQFFNSVNVIAVLMEWVKHRKEGRFIIEFMTRHGFVATFPYVYMQKLDPSRSATWPRDIVWRRRGQRNGRI